MKTVVEWTSLAMLAVALGFAAMAAQTEFGISRATMDVVLIAVISVALAFAFFTWWRYARSLEDDDSADT